jgi:hypothetical protein
VGPNDKKLRKIKKGKITVSLTTQMLVKLNSLRAVAKYLSEMRKDCYLSKWSKAFKKVCLNTKKKKTKHLFLFFCFFVCLFACSLVCLFVWLVGWF